MEDMKGKMKDLIKKANKPFSSSSSSSSSAFKGQARVLGSSPSSSSSSSSSVPSNSSQPRSVLPPQSSITSGRKTPAGINYYDPTLVTSSTNSQPTAATVECPACYLSFPSEESVSAHIDACIGPPTDEGSYAGVEDRVSSFLSAEPAETSVEIVIKLLRNVAREPGNEKFRRIRMGNSKIKEAIGDAKGGIELLECLRFRIKEEDGHKWAEMGESERERERAEKEGRAREGLPQQNIFLDKHIAGGEEGAEPSNEYNIFSLRKRKKTRRERNQGYELGP